jgi:ribosomal subunit interface protein
MYKNDQEEPMDVHVTARHTKLTDEENQDALNAAQHLEHYYSNILRVDVICDNSDKKSAEFTVRVPGHTIVAKESSTEFKKSIHDAAEKVKRLLSKLKTRQIDAPRGATSRG